MVLLASMGGLTKAALFASQMQDENTSGVVGTQASLG